MWEIYQNHYYGRTTGSIPCQKAREQADLNREGWFARWRRKSDESANCENTTIQSSEKYDDASNAQHFYEESGPANAPNSYTKVTFLKCLLWFSLFGLFVALQFGAVFVICSIFYLIYSTMSSSKTREEGELSPYSVFNPNCERINGTLTAEQFERELKYGAGRA